MKFGLISYDYTTNLGNEIQSIAARRFLPQIEYYIEHEKLDSFSKDTNVKTIMNGWYLDCPTSWPPSENIDPLLISMHFSTTTTQERIDAVLSDESKEFFEKKGPVGCRDYHTVEFLKDNGIDAFFTGCLTLTLDSGSKKIDDESDSEYIVVNLKDSEKIVDFLRQRSDKEIFIINQDMIPSLEKAYPETMPKGIYNLTSLYDYKEKFFMAENLLKIYENASCVITDRLHCALPCLAFKTPVLLIKNERMPERFDRISNLLLESSSEEYMGDYSIFDVNSPPENSTEYLKIRESLIKTCEKFTGCINESCYWDISYRELLNRNSLILSRNAVETRRYIEDIISKYKQNIRFLDYANNDIENRKQTIYNLNREIDELKKTVEKQRKIIMKMESSNSWKITSPLRKIRK